MIRDAAEVPGEPEASYTLPLEVACPDALARIGGKAKNLSELLRAGFPVPDGFTVTTRAYAKAAEAAGLGRILEALGKASASDRETLAALAEEARALVLAAPIDEAVARSIEASYAAMGSGAAVAVRSSATAEDLASASFAGQQDTFLNVQGPAALLAAVRRCWASLWTERAAVYRAAVGIDQESVRLAVVVERMVFATVAGVLFTANPVTGRRREAVIDASPGLGEAVVSGAVNPDHFVVDAATGRVLSQRMGDKEEAIVAAEGGGVTRLELGREGRAKDACLSAAELRELAALGARIEAHYGAPQDIEFAFDGSGKLWITQSRPITTLFPLPARAPTSGGDLRVYFSATADEGVTQPMTPMGLQAFRLMISACAERFWDALPADPAAGPDACVEMASRLYYDVTPLLRSSLSKWLVDAMLPSADAHTAALLRTLDADPRLSPEPTSLATVARAVLLPFVRLSLTSRLVAAFVNPPRARAAGQQAMQEAFAVGDVAPDASPGERLERAERLLFRFGLSICLAAWIEPATGFLALSAAELLLGQGVTAAELQIATRGLPHNPTTEMNLALWALAVEIRGNPASARAILEGSLAELSEAYRLGQLPALLQEGLSRFLRRYGHRGVAEIDLGLPRWSEEPAYLFGVLANYLRVPADKGGPAAQFRRAAEEGEAMAAALAERAGSLRGAAVRLCIGRARALLGQRELWKDELSRLFARERRLLLPVGEALVSEARLREPEDIFFVSLPEAKAGLGGADLREIVSARRESYRSELARKRVPAVLLSDGTEPRAEPEGAAAAAHDGVLRGTPASPGKVRARARVLLEPVGARLEPGEVLVAPSTDPGWTPLFMTAGGLVMEKGGSISHGAVVAREVGIPAVVGVPGACEKIQTGQLIEVDGAAGTVVVVT